MDRDAVKSAVGRYPRSMLMVLLGIYFSINQVAI